jgi:hypothetical protein
MSALRGFREDPDMIGLHFHKSPSDREKKPTIALTVSDLSDFQLRKKRSVPRQNSKVTCSARNLQLVHLLVNDRAFRRNDREIDFSFCHY